MTHSGLYSILATATLTGTNGTNGTNAPIMPIMPINKAMGLTIDSLSSPFSLRGESSIYKGWGRGGALPNLKWPSSGRAPILPWKRGEGLDICSVMG